MKKKVVFSLLLVLVLAFGIISCDRSASVGQAGGEVIRIGLDVDAAGPIDPRVSRNTTQMRVIEQIFDGLIDLDENLQPIPVLAERWENPDPLTWIFHLRRGVRFHNGAEFTSRDVKKTYEDIMDPAFNYQLRASFLAISNINADDPYVVIFQLSEPFAPLLPHMTIGIVPWDAAEPEVFGNAPVGTGPYVFREWIRNSRIVVDTNPNYFWGPPATRTIEFYIIPDNSTRVAALEAGDVDIIHSPLSPSDINRLRTNRNFNIFETPGLGVTFLNFNWNSGLITDPIIRRGLSHLIDKETISRDIYMGMDIPAISTLLPVSWAFDPNTINYEFNPSMADAAFREAGFTRGADGFYARGGQRLSITVATHTEDPNRVQTVEFLQNVFTNNGVDTEVVTMEWPSFDAYISSGRYEIALVGLVNIIDPDRYLHSRFHTTGGANYGGHGTPRLDQLINDARRVSDLNERARFYHEAANIISGEVMHNVLLYQRYVAISNVSIQGFAPQATGSFRSLPRTTIR